MKNDNYENSLLETIRKLLNLVFVLVIIIALLPLVLLNLDAIGEFFESDSTPKVAATTPINTETSTGATSIYWTPPSFEQITDLKKLDLVFYGKELIEHTAKFLGPKGNVSSLTNGQNCQNCHLEGGTKIFGNNYGAVASTYPKMRARSGTKESIQKRVNDCFERSLNGKPLKNNSLEMRSIVAYIQFLGSNIPKGSKAEGSGLKDLRFLERAADPVKGKPLYEAKCASCHQSNGEGTRNPDGVEYSFPPLWGSHSFNDGAGLYRLTNMARYVKYNMPFGVSHDQPSLSDEEAWDISAYIISMPHPHKNTPTDWPDISKKPIDHPFGPYADKFTEKQHKYGPFTAIKEFYKK